MNESGHDPIMGIDSAYDEKLRINTLDPKILTLAFHVISYIVEHRDQLTDSYCALIKDATKNVYNEKNHLSLYEYAEYVLEMTYAYGGRRHYDELREIVRSFVSENS